MSPFFLLLSRSTACSRQLGDEECLQWWVVGFRKRRHRVDVDLFRLTGRVCDTQALPGDVCCLLAAR